MISFLYTMVALIHLYCNTSWHFSIQYCSHIYLTDLLFQAFKMYSKYSTIWSIPTGNYIKLTYPDHYEYILQYLG